MSLTQTQIDLIRQSFEALRPDVETASELLYQRLFEIAPGYRAMFRTDMLEQGMRFMTTLEVIVQYLGDPAALRPHLDRLAKGHAAYGVRPEHFKAMGEALEWSMHDVLGARFTPAMAAAWRAAYAHIADEMIRLAG